MKCGNCECEIEIKPGRGQWRKWCSKCSVVIEKQSIKRWILNHPVRKRLYQKKYRTTHKEQRAAYGKLYMTPERREKYNFNRRQARKQRREWKNSYFERIDLVLAR